MVFQTLNWHDLSLAKKTWTFPTSQRRIGSDHFTRSSPKGLEASKEPHVMQVWHSEILRYLFLFSIGGATNKTHTHTHTLLQGLKKC